MKLEAGGRRPHEIRGGFRNSLLTRTINIHPIFIRRLCASNRRRDSPWTAPGITFLNPVCYCSSSVVPSRWASMEDHHRKRLCALAMLHPIYSLHLQGTRLRGIQCTLSPSNSQESFPLDVSSFPLLYSLLLPGR